MSEAFASTVNLSFAVRGGLLMRQMHHWSANIFVGSIVVHMLRIFFTGAFRRPRELNWLVGVDAADPRDLQRLPRLLAPRRPRLGDGHPDRLLDRRVDPAHRQLHWPSSSSAATSPATSIIPRFFILHVLILPAVIAVLIGAHLGMLVRQKHTQFPGRGHYAPERRRCAVVADVRGQDDRLPVPHDGVTGASRARFVQINPIWLYGQYVPYKVSYAVQPDWYMGWLDGALRIMPSWEIVGFGHMIPNAFFPAILLPGITFGVLQTWPFIEAKLTKDTAEHQILDRPRDRPKRTAFGAAVFSFYFVLFGASATDVLANYLSISLNVVLTSFRVLVFVVPVIVFPVTYRICRELQEVPTAGQAQAGERRAAFG